jgi:hypothetical protein
MEFPMAPSIWIESRAIALSALHFAMAAAVNFHVLIYKRDVARCNCEGLLRCRTTRASRRPKRAPIAIRYGCLGRSPMLRKGSYWVWTYCRAESATGTFRCPWRPSSFVRAGGGV